jgi:hypothetical protein
MSKTREDIVSDYHLLILLQKAERMVKRMKGAFQLTVSIDHKEDFKFTNADFIDVLRESVENEIAVIKEALELEE